MRKVVILSFLTSLLLGACGEDDYVYPNVLTDMIDLKTDHTGTGRYLITDEGTEWRIQSRTGLDGLAPDTTYRTVTMYAPLTDSEEAEKEAMFSGLKVAATYSISGAVVGEWLGSQKGLGYYLLRVKNSYMLDKVFACVVVIILLSLAMNGLIRVIAMVSMPYERNKRS